VVDDSKSDRVFRYTVSGTFQNSWLINSANSRPTGITLDPSNGSKDIWIVDSGTDRIYRYANARTLTAPTLTSFIQLAAGNTNPTGIADPPAGESQDQFEVFVDASLDQTFSSQINANLDPKIDRKQQSAEPVITERDEVLAGIAGETMELSLFVSDMKARKTADASILIPMYRPYYDALSKNRLNRAKSNKAIAAEIKDRVFADLL